MKKKPKLRPEWIVPWVIGPKVLDIGCAGHEADPTSPIWLHGFLLSAFPETMGIDLNRYNVEKLNAIGYRNILHGDAQTLNMDAAFNTIVAGELIEHLENPGIFLNGIRRLLAPGGRIILTTPYVFSLMFNFYALARYPKTCTNDEHVMWFCPTTLTTLVQRLGFRIEHMDLIQEYDPSLRNFRYRMFWAILSALSWMLPKHLRRNNILMVLRAS